MPQAPIRDKQHLLMDKKNTTIGVLLLIAALGVMLLGPKLFPARTPPAAVPSGQPPAAQTLTQGPEAAAPEAAPAEPSEAAPAAVAPAASLEPEALFLPAEAPREDERFVSLENDFIEVRFTNLGGAIAEVVLKRYPDSSANDAPPHVLNALHAAPILSLLEYAGADRNTAYTEVSRTADTIVWRATIPRRVEITRSYTISTDPSKRDPYYIRHETTFRNLGSEPLPTPRLVFSLGTAAPVSAHDTTPGLNVGAYDGSDARFVERSQFESGFFSKMFGGGGAPKPQIPLAGPVVWASTKNQFFTTVVAPDQPAAGVSVRRVQFPLVSGEAQPRVGVTGLLSIDGRQLAGNGSETLGFNLYAGPKEYDRLVNLRGANEVMLRADYVMEFGFFAFFAKLLLTLLKALHNHVFQWSDWAWGWAIIGTTVLIRALMWPLTGAAARSAKRMARIQPELKAVQEKYKDNKARQQEETLKLFKAHKVNPVGGCLPMVVQIPVFFGLYTMLRSASELRFAEFLWIPDLSAADTIARVAGFPLNIMPLLMGASMVVQMRMTPTPTTDNASAKMMKFMPFIVTALCYNFSSGLAVYWTASNLFSIFQQWMTNRRKDPVETVAPARPGAAERARPVRDARVSAVADRKKKK